ncbi:MAG: tRNA threonylcarbamoyladenosine dehydratase [Oscillospiraceae bacterium]|nr:tRNA threonylcarbamoyladenosine dehydratase [Oscillospiraceae bacterium]
MDEERFARTELLLGSEAMQRLHKAHVAVFGLGGVGGYVVEALARSGIGALDLVDHDTVSLSNLNRQILATADSIGRYKADAAAERVLSIHPECRVRARRCMFLPETASEFDFREYDYVVDAVDTVTAKLLLIQECQLVGTPVISSMGTGNKLDPSALRVADISKTSVCPLARIMRKELRKRGINHVKVVYSTEEPVRPREAVCASEQETGRRDIPGSVAFVPAAAGLILAGAVIRDLAGIRLKTVP